MDQGAILTLEEVQKVELDIMKELHSWCKDNGIRYCLGYGTLLGAVRHKGFIPWDNDMDILMPRPDFERMLALTRNGKVSKNIDILHHSKDNKYHYSVARACDNRTEVFATYLVEQPQNLGVWVDIFPIDGMPEEKQGVRIRITTWFYKKLQRVDLYSSEKSPILKKIKWILRCIFPNKQNNHMKKIDYYAKLNSFENTQFVADMVEVLPIVMKSEDFNDPMVMRFADTHLYAPKNWQEYLRKAYGDYMSIPSEEERMTHAIKAIWKANYEGESSC